jgi:hypothetical protein
MANLAKVYDDGKIGPTSCCKAPMDQNGTKNGDIFYICQGCGEQVTLVPELPVMSLTEQAAYNLAKVHNANARHVNEDAIAHVARILHDEILECMADFCSEQISYIENSDISVDQTVYSILSTNGINIRDVDVCHVLGAYLFLDRKFWRNHILPLWVDPTLERTGFKRSEMSSFLANFWPYGNRTRTIIEETMIDA